MWDRLDKWDRDVMHVLWSKSYLNIRWQMCRVEEDYWTVPHFKAFAKTFRRAAHLVACFGEAPTFAPHWSAFCKYWNYSLSTSGDLLWRLRNALDGLLVYPDDPRRSLRLRAQKAALAALATDAEKSLQVLSGQQPKALSKETIREAWQDDEIYALAVFDAAVSGQEKPFAGVVEGQKKTWFLATVPEFGLVLREMQVRLFYNGQASVVFPVSAKIAKREAEVFLGM